MDNYLGEIRIFGGNFAPSGWAQCNGQIMSIAQNSALFSLLGTFYGGDGIQTFALPNLQSRVPVGQGQGLGLSPYNIGQTGGVENVTLLSANLPAHNHTFALQANTTTGDQTSPASAIFAPTSDNSGGNLPSFTKNPGNTTMAQQTTSTTGTSSPIKTLPPFIALNYIIALQGIYPSRG